jgi:hypothetical protein
LSPCNNQQILVAGPIALTSFHGEDRFVLEKAPPQQLIFPGYASISVVNQKTCLPPCWKAIFRPGPQAHYAG